MVKLSPFIVFLLQTKEYEQLFDNDDHILWDLRVCGSIGLFYFLRRSVDDPWENLSTVFS